MSDKRIGMFVQVPTSTFKEVTRRMKAQSTKTKKVRMWQVVDQAIRATKKPKATSPLHHAE